MVETTLTVAMLKAAITVLTKKITEKAWEKGSEQAKALLSQFSHGYIAEQYVEKHISRLMKMRTLHSAEQDVFLDEIYTPLKLTAIDDLQEFEVSDNFTIHTPGIINIIGIAGQGKSTLLRKLFLEEIKATQRFPFFIELRKLSGKTILNYLKTQFLDIGLNIVDYDIEYLLQSGRVVLMLDGFDEVPNDKRDSVLQEILMLKTRYNCPAIVTSRPNTEICNEVDITNLKVKKLDQIDIISILNKLQKTSEADELKQLIEDNVQLSDTLVSPILVNLLYVCYPYLDVVPESVVDFYDKLFLTLFSRHDKIKNFNREKYTDISAVEANKIFNAFCYDTLSKNILEFTEESFSKCLQSALKLSQVEASCIESVKKDLINITCLVQEDGYDRFVFLHKSVQEFHAAKFISTLSHEHKINFYTRLINLIDIEDKYDNMIQFLKFVDESNFNSLLILNYFKEKNLHVVDSVDEIIFNILNNSFINLEVKDKVVSLNSMESIATNSAFSSLALLKDGEREHCYEIDHQILNLFHEFSENDTLPTKEILEGEAIEHFSGKDNNSIYRLRILDFLKLVDKLDFISNTMKTTLIYYFDELYTPLNQSHMQVSRILDLDFESMGSPISQPL